MTSVSQEDFYKIIMELKSDISKSLMDFKTEMSQLKEEMTETRTIIRDYNGLREKIDDVDDRVQKIETGKETNKSNRELIGWGVAIVLTAINIIQAFI